MAVALPDTAPTLMRFIEWIKDYMLVELVSFHGRINRRGLAAGFGVWVIWAALIVTVGRIAGGTISRGGDTGNLSFIHICLTAALLLIPLYALMVKRLHDIDRYGWAVCVVLIPYVGWAILSVMLLWKGNANANAFGSPPGQLW